MLKTLQLTNFRNYSKRNFDFGGNTTLIVGPNAVGKTNVLEAIYALSIGKSFRAGEEAELIGTDYGLQTTDYSVGRVEGVVQGEKEETRLEIVWDDRERFRKLYKINGVGKRQVDFVGNLKVVLFCPQDIEIVTDSPSVRRRYLDLVLTQVHKDYRIASQIYDRALRQRNHLLKRVRNFGLQTTDYRSQLSFWDDLLIANGKIIHQRRKEFLNFVSGESGKEGKLGIFPISLYYDHSIISEERLAKYADQEIAAATTLVGPHRDDFVINEVKSQKSKVKSSIQNSKFYVEGTNVKLHSSRGEPLGRDIRLYGSRGEQRMATFELKLGELAYINCQGLALQLSSGQAVSGQLDRSILLLDDVFSELDQINRHLLLEVIPNQQTIMTTTDLHLVEKNYLKKVKVIELGPRPSRRAYYEENESND